jgi:hypothetical protein
MRVGAKSNHFKIVAFEHIEFPPIEELYNAIGARRGWLSQAIFFV